MKENINMMNSPVDVQNLIVINDYRQAIFNLYLQYTILIQLVGFMVVLTSS